MATDTQLKQMMPNLPDAKRAQYLPFLNRTLRDYEINTPLREAAFLAQTAFESGEYRYLEEIWGPTAAQQKYEPPSEVARRLGNTQPGDGERYKGRGIIQITGRFNYQKYGDLLGYDLIATPSLASTVQLAFSIAGLYWQTNGLNPLADAGDFETITRRINGGLNGYDGRLKYYQRAKQVLGAGE
jgi:predicted chitinase